MSKLPKVQRYTKDPQGRMVASQRGKYVKVSDEYLLYTVVKDTDSCFSKNELIEFRKRAAEYVIEELRMPRHDSRSVIGRWMNAIKLECTYKIIEGAITGEEFWMNDKQTQEYKASFGPSPMTLAMAAIFGEHAGKNTPIGKVLDATFPHQVAQHMVRRRK